MSGDDRLKVVIEMVDNLVAPLKAIMAKAQTIAGGVSAKMMSGVQSVTKSQKALGVETDNTSKKAKSAGEKLNGAMTDAKSGLDMAIMAYGMLHESIKKATDASDKYNLSVGQLAFRSKNLNLAKKEMDALIHGNLIYGGVLEDQVGLYKTLRQSGASLEDAFAGVAAAEDVNAIGKHGDAIGKWAAHVKELKDANKNLKTVTGADFRKFMVGAGFSQEDIKKMFDKVGPVSNHELDRIIGNINVDDATRFFASKIVKIVDDGSRAGAMAAKTQGATIAADMNRLYDALFGWMRDADTSPLTKEIKAITSAVKELRELDYDGKTFEYAMRGLGKALWVVVGLLFVVAGLVMALGIAIQWVCETAFPFLVSWLSDVWDAFVDWTDKFSTLPGAIQGVFDVIWVMLYVGFTACMGPVGFFIVWMLQKIVGFAYEIFSVVVRTAIKMFNYGVEIANGLWNGIKSAWGTGASWWDTAVDSLGKVVTLNMAIQSPSKVMAGHGKNISRGLVEGAVDELDRTAPNFASATEDAFRPAEKQGSGRGAGGGGGGTYSVHFGDVHIAAEVSKDIIEKLMPELRKAIHYEFEGMALAAGAP